MDEFINILDFNGKKIGVVKLKDGKSWFDCDDLSKIFGLDLLYEANDLPRTMMKNRVGSGLDDFNTIVSQEGLNKLLSNNGNKALISEFKRFISKELSIKEDTQKFQNELFELEVVLDDGEPLFDAETVAKSLGISRVAESGNEVVRWERVNKYLGKSCPQVGTGDYISEPMVYKLAFKANNAVAEKFQDWLAVDVLPQIRKTGSYSNVPTSFAEALRLAASLEEEKTQLLLENEEMKPKAEFHDYVKGSVNSCTVNHLAKLLKQNGYDTGEKRLFAKLRNDGYLVKEGKRYNAPTQRSANGCWMECVENVGQDKYGNSHTSFQPLITGKGQTYFINKFLKEKKETV